MHSEHVVHESLEKGQSYGDVIDKFWQLFIALLLWYCLGISMPQMTHTLLQEWEL